MTTWSFVGSVVRSLVLSASRHGFVLGVGRREDFAISGWRCGFSRAALAFVAW